MQVGGKEANRPRRLYVYGKFSQVADRSVAPRTNYSRFWLRQLLQPLLAATIATTAFGRTNRYMAFGLRSLFPSYFIL